MQGLKCSKEEAEQVYEYDKAVDHDEKTEYDLTPEQKKVERQMARTGTRKTPTAYKFSKRERKPNATKEGLVDGLFQCLKDFCEFDLKNLHIAEKNGKVCFKINGMWYTWALTEHKRTVPKWIKEK